MESLRFKDGEPSIQGWRAFDSRMESLRFKDGEPSTQGWRTFDPRMENLLDHLT
jgi:hypothetical protein